MKITGVEYREFVDYYMEFDNSQDAAKFARPSTMCTCYSQETRHQNKPTHMKLSINLECKYHGPWHKLVVDLSRSSSMMKKTWEDPPSLFDGKVDKLAKLRPNLPIEPSVMK